MRNLYITILLILLSPYCLAENTEYFVFVGEKISVERVPDGESNFDEEFVAKYRVIESLKGSFEGGEIEFIAYDHYGTPEFSAYSHVLLFVIRSNGKYFHSKYMFNPLYRTKSERWAGPYSTSDYSHEYNKTTKIKPEIIDFVEPIEADLSGLSFNQIKMFYPKPYYVSRGKKATTKYGNYVEELFQLKQDGVLKARGELQ